MSVHLVSRNSCRGARATRWYLTRLARTTFARFLLLVIKVGGMFSILGGLKQVELLRRFAGRVTAYSHEFITNRYNIYIEPERSEDQATIAIAVAGNS